MGRRFWWVYLFVLFPGVSLLLAVALLFVPLSAQNWSVLAIAELVFLGAMLAILVIFRGTESLGEKPWEILDEVEEEDEAAEGESVPDRPLYLQPGELTAEELTGRFDRVDGNRPGS